MRSQLHHRNTRTPARFASNSEAMTVVATYSDFKRFQTSGAVKIKK